MSESSPRRHVRVKICGVSRPQDAVAAEAAGADAIGLNFAPRSRRFVTLEGALRVTEALGPLVIRFGVFVNAPEEEILRAVETLRLDVVQLHGDEPPAMVEALRRRTRVVRAVRFRAGLLPADVADVPCDGLLLDGPVPGSGRAFDLADAAAWRGHPRLLLAGGLRPDTVARAVAALDPYGVDVASGVEASPGVKDPEAMAAFVRAARAGITPEPAAP